MRAPLPWLRSSVGRASRRLRLVALLAVALASPAAFAQLTYNWLNGIIPITVVGLLDTLNISTTSDHGFNGVGVVNLGTVNWSGGYLRSGNDVIFLNSGTFNDSASSHVDNPYGGGYYFRFSNGGTYHKTATGITYFDTTFNNTGAVSISAGEFQLLGGGTSSGTFTVSSGATVTFGADYALSDGSSLTGLGTYQVTAGTLSVTGDLTIEPNVSAAGLNFAGGALGGTHTLHGAKFTWTSGDWSSGSSATTTIASDGTLYIAAGNDHSFNRRNLTNQGKIYWQGGQLLSGTNAVFLNSSGATFYDSASSHIANPFGGGYGFTFSNAGTYSKTATGITYLDTTFNNSGSVAITAGEFRLLGGGTNTGTFATGSGATTTFGADYSLASGTTLTGAGAYELTGGTLTVTGSLTASNFTFSGGTLGGTHTLHSATGTSFTWSSASWNATSAATTTIASDGTLYITTGTDHNFNQRSVTNQGKVYWQGGKLLSGTNATFANASGGQFYDSADNRISNPFGGGYGFTFSNAGTYTKTGSGVTYLDTTFDNSGSVVISAGEFQLLGGGTNAAAGTFSAASSATVTFGSNYSLASGTTLTGAGSYQLTGGTLSVDGSLTASNFAFTGGTLGGTHTLHSATGTSFTWSSASWSTGGSATTTIASDGVLYITTTTDHEFNRRNVTNQGTVYWQNGKLLSGTNSTFTNAATGVFNDSGGTRVSNPYGGGYGFTFSNLGTYNKTGASSTYFDTTFDNAGSVSVQAGTLQLLGGGTNSGTGQFYTAAAATVTFGASYSLASGTQLNGPGTYELTAGTLTVSGDLTASKLNFTGGALAGTHTLHGSNYTWSGGDWSTGGSATTTIASDGVLNLSTSSDHDFNRRNILNQGSVVWNDGTLRSGTNATFTNAAGASFTDYASNHISNPFGGGYGFTFSNAGTYAKGSPGTTYLDTTFDNSGTVQVYAGEFILNGGGTNAGTGTFATSSGATTTFATSYVLASGSTFTGAGTLQLTGGTLSVDGSLTTHNLSLLGGTLAGTHTLHGTGYTWTSSDLSTGGSATTTIASDARLTIVSSSDHDFNRRNIVNQGAVEWQAGDLRSGTNASFTNAAGATFTDSAANHLSNPFGGGYGFTFANAGTYTKTGSGITYLDTTFNNTGAVNLTAGQFHLGGGGTNAATGTMTVATGALVYFTASYTLDSGSSLTGAGLYKVTGGTLSVDGSLTAGNLQFYGGALGGNHTLHSVPGTTYRWVSGDWSSGSSVTTTIASDGVLAISGSGDHDFNRRNVTNQGTIDWSEGKLRSGTNTTLTNASGATFNDSASSHIENPFGGGYYFTFANAGTYNKTASGTTNVDVSFTNTGAISVSNGRLQFNGGFTNTNGAIAVASGATLASTAPITMGTGALSGGGTVEASSLTAGGHVSPASRLTIDGNLTLASTSTFIAELGGTSQGTTYDFLNVTGTTTLGGTLSVSFTSGFRNTVAPTDTFTILSANTLTGGFINAATNGTRFTTTDGLSTFQINFSGGNVVLSNFSPVPEPSTYALLGLGLVIVGAYARRRS